MTGTTILRDPTLDERVHRRVFSSGLTVYVLRKPEFTRSYATLREEWAGQAAERRLFD